MHLKNQYFEWLLLPVLFLVDHIIVACQWSGVKYYKRKRKTIKTIWFFWLKLRLALRIQPISVAHFCNETTIGIYIATTYSLSFVADDFDS